MGHGWVPDSRTPYQKVTSEDGAERYTFCPLGTDFLAYIRGQIATLAAERPDFFMLDDDTRLITGRNGCYCPLHIAEMERRTGRAFTRETLAAAVHGEPETARLYNGLLRDSILVLARAIREELDKVDPATPCSFCCCSKDVRHAAEIARALAAPGQELVIRLNNGRYLSETLRDVPGWIHRTAAQVAVLRDEATILAAIKEGQDAKAENATLKQKALEAEAEDFAEKNSKKCNKEVLKAQYIANKDVAKALVEGIPEPTAPTAQKVLNKGGAAKPVTDQREIEKQRNKAIGEYRAAHPGCTFSTAWGACRKENPELFQQ